jgi:hypothetical protein
MMTERCSRCKNLSGLCAQVGCGGFVEKAPLNTVDEIDNSIQQTKGEICPSCNGTGKAHGNTLPGNLHPCEDCQ